MRGLFLHKTPQLLQAIFPNFWWRKSRLEKTVYLTFDDGPVPEATPLILKCLREYGAKATFFCVGANIVKNPKIFHQLIKEGHRVGNHTHHHLNGWKTDTDDFIAELEAIAPTYVTIDEDGKKGCTIETTPIVSSESGTLAMSILSNDEVEFVKLMTTMTNLGTYEEIFADAEKDALYKLVYPYDVPLNYIDEDGAEVSYMRPKKIGEFA